MRARLLALPLALAAPLALPAAPAAAAAVQAPGETAEARALARLVHPIDLAVATAAEGADRYFVASMLKNPEIAALEEMHPGVTEVMYRAARPIMIEAERRNAANAQDKLVALYVKELSAADIETLHAFFSSPTGVKVVRGMFNPESIRHTAEAVAADPEGGIKAETLLEGQADSLDRMVATMTPEDEQVAARLIGTPAGQRWHALTPKVQAMMVELVNIRHPDLDAKVNAAMEAAVQAFVAKPKN